ncbi:hypothetical protein P43SY_005500 [Pythium insidiosum]|uniref:Centriolar satellite-associated tubulin polyglutamylase complex regulator 1 n=1 Tax=Pythium insidiosum TaxID=114742 RepID=A0AAD5MFI7_PYTIN|nr:hypothetical protein P43SY_005500 [Pythium insidiosum]
MTRLRAQRIVASALRLIDQQDPAAVAANGVVASSRRPSVTASRVSPAQDTYLTNSGVYFLMEDLVKRLDEDRPEQVSSYISTYFAAIAKGTHIRGRDFEFINGTLQNRLAFLQHIHSSFAGVDTSIEITREDFAELVRHQCRNYPLDLLQQASAHLDEDAEGEVCAPLHSFLDAFRVTLVFHEFLSKVHDIYADAAANRATTPNGPSLSESIVNARAVDRVVARLRLIRQQIIGPVPPVDVLEPLVFKCATYKESEEIANVIDELQAAFACLSSQI